MTPHQAKREALSTIGPMRYLHTMVRVADLDAALAFYRDALGLVETRRSVNEKGRFTLVFLAAPADESEAREMKRPEIELTHNWDPEPYTGGRNFGHIAYEVADIYAACARLQQHGVTILRPPRDGRMAFVRSPEQISIELLQRGPALPPAEPWLSMVNSGSW
jgi:lactoylglutathione lyase